MVLGVSSGVFEQNVVIPGGYSKIRVCFLADPEMHMVCMFLR